MKQKIKVTLIFELDYHDKSPLLTASYIADEVVKTLRGQRVGYHGTLEMCEGTELSREKI